MAKAIWNGAVIAQQAPLPDSIAEDVRRGLTATPKQLPPRLFYDAAGSELFEAITRLPEYYLTRAELELFERHAPEIVGRTGSGLTRLVELGAGTAYKTRVLIRAVLERQPNAIFVPIDVSPHALEQARQGLAREFPALEIQPRVGRYRSALEGLRADPGRKLVLFIGSSVGNFDPPEAIALLKELAEALAPGDALLLGTDLAKDASLLLPAYDDAAGVTARFNKNILARINRDLGGHFEPEAFRHVALWNPGESRIEMHLESARAHQVRIDALELTVSFEAGERIHTENSYKFNLAMVERILDGAGFALEQTWYDSRRWFAEHLARRR